MTTIETEIEIIVLMENPRKNTPLGPILRCLAACGIQQLWTVGYAQCSNVQGAHGADKHVHITAFPTAGQAVTALSWMRQGGTNDNNTMSVQSTTAATTTADPVVTIIGLLGAFPNGYNEQDGYPVIAVNDDTSSNINNTTGIAHPVDETQDVNQFRNDSSQKLGRSYPVYALPSLSLLLQKDTESSQFTTAVASIAPPPPIPSSNPTMNKRILCLVISKDRKLGLPVSLAQHCHLFCHVPCIPLHNETTVAAGVGVPTAIPLLDAPCTITITLQHLISQLQQEYNCYHRYHEHTFQGNKFVAASNPPHSQSSSSHYRPHPPRCPTNGLRDDEDEHQYDDIKAQALFWNSTTTDPDDEGDY
jgi:hypothetical protein